MGSKGLRVLVPVDGHPTDKDAVDLACRVVKRDKGRVYVMHVIEVDRSLPLDADMAADEERGEQVLAQAEQAARAAEYQIEAEILQAREAGPAIVDEARARGVDLIIMGVIYRKKFGEFDLGKTTPYVLKNAHCRVWVLRGDIVADVPATGKRA